MQLVNNKPWCDFLQYINVTYFIYAWLANIHHIKFISLYMIYMRELCYPNECKFSLSLIMFYTIIVAYQLRQELHVESCTEASWADVNASFFQAEL